MTLKQRSAIVSFGSIIFIVVVMGIIINFNILSEFQQIEDQRVDQNIRRLEYILSDKLAQLDSKLSDWAIWDDTYNFIINKNPTYTSSNFSTDAFIKLGVDDVLFIDEKGGLFWSFSVDKDESITNTSTDLYSNFATGSALTKIDKKHGNRSGILALHNRLHLFSVREILKSDGTGPAQGVMVFSKHFDSKELISLREMTQFDTTLLNWGDKDMASAYTEGKKILIKRTSESVISGYLTIIDAFGNPQGILRADVTRDITLQGKATLVTLMAILMSTGVIVALLNFGVINNVILKKILTISTELRSLGGDSFTKKRLSITNENDEVDVLRKNINQMLNDIELSHNQLQAEVNKRESLIELVDSIVVMLDQSSCITMINKYGCKVLGYTTDELIGKNWIDTIICPDEREMIRTKLAELINSSASSNRYIENSIQTKGKTNIIYGWHNTIIKNSKGDVTATLSVGNDITAIKKELSLREDYTNTLKQMNEVMIGRELKMIELKNRIAELEHQS